MNPTLLVAYLGLFLAIGGLFLFGALLFGRFLRAHSPSAEKLATYECGEPAVGSSDIQFDLRFYVMALVFIVFEVEVAFFFPWAVVFGKATEVSRLAAVAAAPAEGASLQPVLRAKSAELLTPAGRESADVALPSAGIARRFLQLVLVEMLFFFALLLVAFAFVWYQGDLDWVWAVPAASARSSTPRTADAVGTA